MRKDLTHNSIHAIISSVYPYSQSTFSNIVEVGSLKKTQFYKTSIVYFNIETVGLQAA